MRSGAASPGEPGGTANRGRRRARGASVRALGAQVRAETFMTLRRGETLLLTIGIPVVFLIFFSSVHVVETGTPKRVTFIVPGILALAIMSTAMVSLGIATGFERGYGVLKRLGSTPLGRPRLLGAKVATILVVEALQAAVLVPVGARPRLAAPGRRPGRPPARPWPWPCWARRPSPGSACAWPGCCGPRSTWPRPTASTWCSCSWAG